MDHYSLVVYISIFILSYVLTKTILHKKLQNLPPSPFPTLPILGHLHLLKPKKNVSIHRALAGLSEKYGPVVNLQLGARRALLVASHAAAEDCFHGHNDVIFANRPRLIGAKYVGMGYNYTTMLWAPYGPLWRNHRRIASTEILSPHRLHLLSTIRSDEVRSMIRRIAEASSKITGDQTVEVKPPLFEMTNNIMLRMIAGKRFYGEGLELEEAKRFKELMKELMGSGGAFCNGDFFPVLKHIGNKFYQKKFNSIGVKLDKFFQDVVDEHRKGDSSSSKKSSKCMIEVMLDLQKSDPTFFTDDIIKGLVQILLLAGTETSASTMEWALSLLLNNLQVLHKAQKEIDEHVGYDRLIEENDLSRLPYLHCIINETLRMYPAAPILPPHESTADCIVGGYRVPKGTMLMVNVWAIQNDPKVWDEPSVFKPERFEVGEGDNKLGCKFMPFGSGRRACPGENLAKRVVGLTLGSLIQCFDWKRVGEELVDMEEQVGMTIWKAKPLKAKCRPRKNIFKLSTISGTI